MKSDLDTLMRARNLDALVVLGNAEHNPPMYYLTGGGHVTAATLVKAPGAVGVLFCGDMERDEAAKSGLDVRLYSQYPLDELMQAAGGDFSRMEALRFQRILQDLGLQRARLGLYGNVELSRVLRMVEHLKELMPEVTILGDDPMDSLFLRAMATKSEAEVERIRRMGAITSEVVALTARLLRSSQVRADEVLLKEDGTPLTVGDVKRRIDLWLAERGAVPTEGYIFAIGADAGVPHSQGNPDDVMRLGRTIVFDIYPQEAGGGYFYDFTRTWSLGYATPEAQSLYDQVREVYGRVIGDIDLNAPFKHYQRMTCEYFAERGHQTVLDNPATKQGYIHSLGHGVGLNIHERPFSSLYIGDDHRLEPGAVITIEPGLYYPEQGMGFRIEDTYWLRSDGKLEILAEYPYDFVLPMDHWKAQEAI